MDTEIWIPCNHISLNNNHLKMSKTKTKNSRLTFHTKIGIICPSLFGLHTCKCMYLHTHTHTHTHTTIYSKVFHFTLFVKPLDFTFSSPLHCAFWSIHFAFCLFSSPTNTHLIISTFWDTPKNFSHLQKFLETFYCKLYSAF